MHGPHSSLLSEVTFSSVESCWLELTVCVVSEVLLLSLFVSPENKSDWLLLVLGVESSSGCFFWKSFSLCGFLFSAKHLEQRFIVLLDPQNPQGHRGGRLGALLRSLPASPMAGPSLRRGRVAGAGGRWERRVRGSEPGFQAGQLEPGATTAAAAEGTEGEQQPRPARPGGTLSSGRRPSLSAAAVTNLLLPRAGRTP